MEPNSIVCEKYKKYNISNRTLALTRVREFSGLLGSIVGMVERIPIIVTMERHHKTTLKLSS